MIDRHQVWGGSVPPCRAKCPADWSTPSLRWGPRFTICCYASSLMLKAPKAPYLGHFFPFMKATFMSSWSQPIRWVNQSDIKPTCLCLNTYNMTGWLSTTDCTGTINILSQPPQHNQILGIIQEKQSNILTIIKRYPNYPDKEYKKSNEIIWSCEQGQTVALYYWLFDIYC